MRHIHVAPVFWFRSVIDGAVPPVKSMICSGMNTDCAAATVTDEKKSPITTFASLTPTSFFAASMPPWALPWLSSPPTKLIFTLSA